MRKKIFTFLLALAASVGVSWATTVTWNSSTISSIGNLHDGQSFTKDGVTLTVLAGLTDPYTGSWMGVGEYASFKFSTSLGNFTRIEITGTIYGLGGSGWTQTSPGAVWTGEANETTFGEYFENVSQIVFTIADATTAVTGVTLNKSAAEMTVGGETLTLIPTVLPNNATNKSVTWTSSDGNVATVNNGVVTAVAAGTANITVTTVDGNKTATCVVTVSNPALAVAYTLQLVADPIKGSVAVTNLLGSGIVDNGDGTYSVPEGAEVTLQATPNEGYEFTGWKAGSVGCDFTDCGNALSTVDNPLTFDMNNEVAFMAEFAAVTPTPQPVTDPITPYADPQDASVYYSTFYDSNFKYELPTGVEAYVADLSGANLLLTKIAEAGEVIPANVAVILKATVTPFTLTVSDADAVTFTATNDLQGSDTQIATPANCYVLAGTDGVVGFYHYTAANLNAHKAYVVYSGSNQAPRRMPFIFDQATGVENVQNSDIRSQKVVENGQLIIIRNGVRYNAAGQNVK